MFTSLRVKYVRPRPMTPSEAGRLAWILRIATAAAFIGHGGYGAILAKADWVRYFGALGISATTVQTASLSLLVGCFEIALGVAVLYKPVRALLLGMLVWKVVTEFLRPVVGEPGWEFIERASNMIAPLALIYVRGWPRTLREWLR
jgi:hypothetical protein